MTTPKSTKKNAHSSAVSKDVYSNTINESTSVWINFDHDTTDDDEDSLNPLNIIQKRVLFVSLIQLYRSYVSIPSFILENALFAFGIKRSWLFPSTLTQINEAKNTYIQHFKSNWSHEFIQIIKDKDKKGHILWIEPCTNTTKTQEFWNKISNQLTTIADTSILKENNTNNSDDIPMFVQDKSRPSNSNILTSKKTEKPNKILSISQQILNPSKACVGFTFTQYTDDDDDVSSDSDFEDEQKTAQKRCCRLKVPGATNLLEDKSRPSQHDIFGYNYSALKLDKSWWKNKYEESRKKQCCLASLTDRKSKDLTDCLEIISKFNIFAEDVITQLECIGAAKDFQFGPLKELFYQSNPTLIPMDNFDINMYVESHSNGKYVDLLAYCKQYLCPYVKYNDEVDGIDDGLESDYSISMDLIQQKSNSMLPCGGRIRDQTSPDIKLFDSESKILAKINVITADHEDKKDIHVTAAASHEMENEVKISVPMENDTSGSVVSALSNSELDHLEYYLSNTITNQQPHKSSNKSSNLRVINLKKSIPKRKKKRLSFEHESSWCYEPLSKYRAKGHLFISKQFTKDIIPNMIKENICNVWQFMDKTSAILKHCSSLIKTIKHLNKRIKVINYGFHDKDCNKKLYCVLEENLDKNINYEWIMMDKLFNCTEMEKQFKIKCDELPLSVTETVEYKLNEEKIKKIIKNKEKMRKIILKTKWHKIPIKNKEKLNKKRITLAMNKEEFIKNLILNNNINGSKDINLVPIVMFHNKHNKYRMEYIWIVRIDVNIDIGISLIYNAKSTNNPLQIGAIHLNKTFITNQHELISTGNGAKLPCLQRFTSMITNLNIGNPDDCINRVKDLHKRNQDLRDEQQKLRLLNEKLMANNKELQQIKQMYNKLISNNTQNKPVCDGLIIYPFNNVNGMSAFNQMVQNKHCFSNDNNNNVLSKNKQ